MGIYGKLSLSEPALDWVLQEVQVLALLHFFVFEISSFHFRYTDEDLR